MKPVVISFLSALAIGWGGVVLAEEFRSPMLGSFEAGVLCAPEPTGTREAPDTVAGTTNVIDEAPPFVSTGRRVPAVEGVAFGVKAGMMGGFRLDGVVMSISHPELIGSGVTHQQFITSVGPADDPGITFYQFDYDYEMVVGDWTLTARSGAVKLYEVTFTVVPPSDMPELAGVCGFSELLS